MKAIKLKRKLWNADNGDMVQVTDDQASWAVSKGYAEYLEIPKAKEEKETPANKIEKQPIKTKGKK